MWIDRAKCLILDLVTIFVGLNVISVAIPYYAQQNYGNFLQNYGKFYKNKYVNAFIKKNY